MRNCLGQLRLSLGIMQRLDRVTKCSRPCALFFPTTPQEPELHKSMLLLLARAWDYKVRRRFCRTKVNLAPRRLAYKE